MVPAKTYFYLHFLVGILDVLYVGWAKKINLVEPLVLLTRTWSCHIVISKYSDHMQYHMILLEQCGYLVATVQATVAWFDEDQNHVCLVTWQDYFFLYPKLFLPSVLNSLNFWSSMSCIKLEYGLADNNITKELGVLFDNNVQGYPYRPPKKYKPTKYEFSFTKNYDKIV